MPKIKDFSSTITVIDKKIWIFDRDGVINEKPVEPNRYVLAEDALILNFRVIDFIAQLQKRGLIVTVATNQQCVGKKLITEAKLDKIHHKINEAVQKSGGQNLTYYVCTHLVEDNCDCRKPKPGLLNSIMKDFSMIPQECIFIGDSVSDKEAAQISKIKFMNFKDFKTLINDHA
jgi:D-glycero-D-manno-heptose 1,7-bisphosphate phosphatase